jgi:hypothetical protein
MLGPPVRRYIDGIVPHEAHHRLVQSKPRTPRGGGKDGSGEEGDDCGIDETPEHLTRTVWLRLSLTGESRVRLSYNGATAAQTGTGLGEYKLVQVAVWALKRDNVFLSLAAITAWIYDNMV